MPITATSSAALALHGLIDLVANSATFRQRAEVVDARDALSRIHLTERSELNDEQLVCEAMPLAIVTIDAHKWKSYAVGSQQHLAAEGGCYLVLAAQARLTGPDDCPKDSEFDFLNFAFGVVDEIAAASGKGNFWPFREIELLDYCRADIDRRVNEDFWTAAFLCRFDAGEGL